MLEPNRYLLNGRLDLYSLAKLLDTELPEEDADTLGGLIYSELGHVPVPGETVEVGGWRFTVLTLDGRRIEEVRAEVINLDEETSETEQDKVALRDQENSSVPDNSPASVFKYSTLK